MQKQTEKNAGAAPSSQFRLGLFKQFREEIRREDREQKREITGNVKRMLIDLSAAAERKFYCTLEIYIWAEKVARQEYSSADITMFLYMAREIPTIRDSQEMIGIFASAFANNNSEDKVR